VTISRESTSGNSYAKRDHISLKGFDRNKVFGNNGQLVLVNRESLNTIGSDVHKTKPVSLALLEMELGESSVWGAFLRRVRWHVGAVKVVFAIDKVVIALWRNLG
jgi:hypothetical protein